MHLCLSRITGCKSIGNKSSENHIFEATKCYTRLTQEVTEVKSSIHEDKRAAFPSRRGRGRKSKGKKRGERAGRGSWTRLFHSSSVRKKKF